MRDASDIGLQPKPAFGKPCNGCGVCCLQDPCPIVRNSDLKWEQGYLCEGLEVAGDRYLCGPARFEAEMDAGPVIQAILATDTRCECFILGYKPDNEVGVDAVARNSRSHWAERRAKADQVAAYLGVAIADLGRTADADLAVRRTVGRIIHGWRNQRGTPYERRPVPEHRAPIILPLPGS